jgi:hypothetical protein
MYQTGRSGTCRITESYDRNNSLQKIDMDALVQELNSKLRQWQPDIAEQGGSYPDQFCFAAP